MSVHGRSSLALAALFATGCSLTAPIAGGPVRSGTLTQLQPSWSVAYGRASARVGGTSVSGNGQTLGGPLPWNFGPAGVTVVRRRPAWSWRSGSTGPARGAATVALAPWIVLDSGAPSKAACIDCAQSGPVSDFSQRWGVSLIFFPALAGDLIH